MGINSQGVAYDFGQMGSTILLDTNVELFAPTGKVIVAITTLEAMKFTKLVADTKYLGDSTTDHGVISFGTVTATLAQGENAAGDTVIGDTLTNAVQFPEGLTIYGRWTSVQCVDMSGSSDTNPNGVIIYYGPA